MIHVQWNNVKQSTLLLKFEKDWTREDFIATARRSYMTVSSVDSSVDIVVDLSESQSTSRNFVNIVLHGMRLYSENTGQIVVISQSNLWEQLYRYITRAYPRDVVPVKFLPTYFEAIEYLNTSNETTEKSDDSKSVTGKARYVPPFVEYVEMAY